MHSLHLSLLYFWFFPYTFSVQIIGGRLCLHLVVRSNDMILGNPHDTAGFALLAYFLAQKLQVPAGVLTVSISNAHIYDIHIEQATELCRRSVLHSPLEFICPTNAFERAENLDNTLVQACFDQLKNQYNPQPSFGKMPIVDLYVTKISGWPKVFKAIFDKIFATISLLVLSPVFLIIGFLIWRPAKKDPIFYKSIRIGKNGHPFNCFKFRSMVVGAEKMKAKLLSKNERKGGVLFKIKDDPRITPIGKFLREWSLDELPQLFNVLKGDMSIIGPRPHLPEEVTLCSERQQYLLGILPGLSGFAQINNRGDTKLSFEEEMRYELFYLKNWNFWLDLTILFKTIWILVQRKNY